MFYSSSADAASDSCSSFETVKEKTGKNDKFELPLFVHFSRSEKTVGLEAGGRGGKMGRKGCGCPGKEIKEVEGNVNKIVNTEMQIITCSRGQ